MSREIDDLKDRHVNLAGEVEKISRNVWGLHEKYCPKCERDGLVYTYTTIGKGYKDYHRCLACLTLFTQQPISE